jgi:hypothetical protein
LIYVNLDPVRRGRHLIYVNRRQASTY